MRRKAAYLTAKRKIEIRSEEIPRPGAGQVLIRVKALGICGSDVSYYVNGASGMGKIEYPFLLGHECAGEVEAVGDQVSKLHPGDRITVEPGVPCGECAYCRTGKYNLCGNMAFMASAVKRPGGEGGMAEYILRPAAFTYRIPDSITFEQAALLEPISVAIHAVERSGIKAGQNAAILGCGPIAGCILQVLKAYGAARIYMTDVIRERAERMGIMGAERTYPVGGIEEHDLQGLLPEEVDVVFDTSVNESAINASMYWLKRGGSLVFVGVPTGKKRLDLQEAFVRELSLVTSFRYANTYETAIALVSEGKLRPVQLISHRFSLECAEQALEKAAEKTGSVMKVMIESII